LITIKTTNKFIDFPTIKPELISRGFCLVSPLTFFIKMKSETLKRKDRLRSRKVIEALFKSKRVFTVYPFRVYWSVETSEVSSLQMAISVPKKWLKKAVLRNQIKRKTREAYRIRKNDLSNHLIQTHQSLRFFLVYASKNLLLYSDIESKIELILQELKKRSQIEN